MQISERGMMGPGFEMRLRAALDRIVPPTPRLVDARYRSMMPARSSGIRRLAPALVGIAALVTMATSATVATGSTNPAVWTQRAASTIQSVRHVPDAKPKSPQSLKSWAPSNQPSGAGRAAAPPSRQNEPAPKSEPSDRAEGSPRAASAPRPSDGPNPPASNGPRHGPEATFAAHPLDGWGGSRGRLPSDFGWDRRF